MKKSDRRWPTLRSHKTKTRKSQRTKGENRDGRKNNSYHPTQEWAGGSPEETDPFMSLVATKPHNKENEVWSGVSSFFYPAKDCALKLRPWQQPNTSWTPADSPQTRDPENSM